MASIRSYRTSKGERRYEVRYHDGDGKKRSQAFSSHRDAQAFKLDIERKRQPGKLSSHRVEGRRLFAEGEVRRWLLSRHEGSTLDGNGAGR
jgi:hypothetical protein